MWVNADASVGESLRQESIIRRVIQVSRVSRPACRLTTVTLLPVCPLTWVFCLAIYPIIITCKRHFKFIISVAADDSCDRDRILRLFTKNHIRWTGEGNSRTASYANIFRKHLHSQQPNWPTTTVKQLLLYLFLFDQPLCHHPFFPAKLRRKKNQLYLQKSLLPSEACSPLRILNWSFGKTLKMN